MSNIRISNIESLDTPLDIKLKIPIDRNIEKLINSERQKIENIIKGDDTKLVVIVGPCSIHDPDSAIEYSDFILRMREEFKDTLVIVMRTYFSKPRTTIGWKGLVYDPDLNNNFNIKKGICIARRTLINILNKGVPCSMEHLDTIIPQYFDDLLAWAAIGARTTESQIHRELASGCSTPVGFKNGTGGSIELAINAIECSNRPHHFLGCNEQGNISRISTSGNPFTHLILRGSNKQPNYYPEIVEETIKDLKSRGLNDSIFIDFSHGNSQKKHKNQIRVSNNITDQISNGNFSIRGVMIESHLVEGKQSIDNNPLVYGQSITDACINLEDTYLILKKLHWAKINRDCI